MINIFRKIILFFCVPRRAPPPPPGAGAAASPPPPPRRLPRTAAPRLAPVLAPRAEEGALSKAWGRQGLRRSGGGGQRFRTGQVVREDPRRRPRGELPMSYHCFFFLSCEPWRGALFTRREFCLPLRSVRRPRCCLVACSCTVHCCARFVLVCSCWILTCNSECGFNSEEHALCLAVLLMAFS